MNIELKKNKNRIKIVENNKSKKWGLRSLSVSEPCGQVKKC